MEHLTDDEPYKHDFRPNFNDHAVQGSIDHSAQSISGKAGDRVQDGASGEEPRLIHSTTAFMHETPNPT
jgi:hypothetical protein